MACASNGLTITKRRAEQILPHLTYLRINFSAGEGKRYSEIMGAKEAWFDRVCQNIRDMMEIKRRDGLDVTVGMQMVVMPEYEDQLVPLAKLGAEPDPVTPDQFAARLKDEIALWGRVIADAHIEKQ